MKAMKKILTVITLSLGALITTSAMAAPQDYNRSHDHDSRWDQRNDHRSNTNDRYKNSRVNPSRDWRSGQYLPRSYDSSRYHVSDREARRLPNTGRYQQWYKINGDYVLVNERNNRILRIIG